MNKKVILFTIFFTVLMTVGSLNTSVFASVDGTVGTESVYDSAVITGVVTKDITDVNNIFMGTYGDGLTYSLPYSLLSGEIYDSSASVSSSAGYGNISFNPAYVHHDYYNSSGLLQLNKWTETDPDSVFDYTTVTVDDISKTTGTLRIDVTANNLASANAYIIHEFAVPRSIDKYFIFGMKIYEETLNVSYAIRIRLIDSSQQELFITLVEDSADWSFSEHSVSAERVLFDDDADDVILFQMKIADWDAQVSTIDMSSVQKVSIQFYTSAPVDGSFTADVFAFDFVDFVVKAGIDRSNELTSDSDYVPLNVTDPSDPILKVRQIDSHISRIDDAQIDFVYIPEADSELYDDSDFSVTRKWELMLDVDDEWADEVSFSNLKLYYVLGASSSKYTTFQYGGQEKSSLLLNEEAGDAIELASTLETNTIYLLEVERTYTSDEFDDMISGASLGFIDSAIVWIREKLALFFGAIGLTALSAYFYKKNRATKSRAKSRK